MTQRSPNLFPFCSSSLPRFFALGPSMRLAAAPMSAAGRGRVKLGIVVLSVVPLPFPRHRSSNTERSERSTSTSRAWSKSFHTASTGSRRCDCLLSANSGRLPTFFSALQTRRQRVATRIAATIFASQRRCAVYPAGPCTELRPDVVGEVLRVAESISCSNASGSAGLMT